MNIVLIYDGQNQLNRQNAIKSRRKSCHSEAKQLFDIFSYRV